MLNLAFNDISDAVLSHLKGEITNFDLYSDIAILVIISIWIILNTYIYIFLFLWHAVLKNLESLNLDSCRIGDDGLVHLAGYSFVIFFTMLDKIINFKFSNVYFLVFRSYSLKVFGVI